MYPDLVYLFGVEISIWNLTFLVGAVLGYGVLILTFRLGNECFPSAEVGQMSGLS